MPSRVNCGIAGLYFFIAFGWAVGFVFTIFNDWIYRFDRIDPSDGKLGDYNYCRLPLFNGERKTYFFEKSDKRNSTNLATEDVFV